MRPRPAATDRPGGRRLAAARGSGRCAPPRKGGLPLAAAAALIAMAATGKGAVWELGQVKNAANADECAQGQAPNNAVVTMVVGIDAERSGSGSVKEYG